MFKDSNDQENRSRIIESSTFDQFQAIIDEGDIAHILVGKLGKELYGTTEHKENIEILENFVNQKGIESADNTVFVMLDTHHDFYNPDSPLGSGNWAPHAFEQGLLPEPNSLRDEVYPFILVTEKSDDLGAIMLPPGSKESAWDGNSVVNLPGINEARGPVTLVPSAQGDKLLDLIRSAILSGKKLIVNIDLDFGEIQKPSGAPPKTRFGSLIKEPWIAELLELADIIITNRSPHFNQEVHYKEAELEILEFLNT